MADGYWTNTARSWLGQGLAMGWGDELEARLRTMSGDETYEEELAAINESYDQYAAENPGASLTGEIVGGFLPTAAALIATPFTGGAAAPVAAASGARTLGALGNIANKARQTYKNTLGRNNYSNAATIGTTSGGLTAAGMADPGERMGQGFVGAVTGGILGTALPIAGRGSMAVFGYLKDRLAKSGAMIDDIALKKVYDAIASEGGTPADVLRVFNESVELGVPSTITNTNRRTVGLADSLSAAEKGDVPRIINDALEKTQTDARGRVVAQTKSALSDKNFYEESDQLVNTLRANAKGAYDEAYAFGSISDPRVLTLLETNPSLTKAFKAAQRIAKTEFDIDVARGGDGSAFQLIPYNITKDAQGKITSDLLPDVRTIDYIKRGLDQEITAKFKAGKGAEATALKDLKNTLVNLVDDATTVDGRSAYAEARKLFKGDREVIEALELGKTKFNSMAPEEVAGVFEGLSTGEADAFLTGATRNLLNLITKPSNDANFAKKIIGSPDMRKKIQMLFPAADESGLALYEAALLRESQLYRETSKILGGSPTAQREAGKAALGEGTGVGDVVADAVATLGSPSAITGWVSRIIRSSSLPSQTQEKMARMLMSDDPKKVAMVVASLEEFAERQIPKVTALNRREQANVFGASQILPKSGSDGTSSVTLEETVTEDLEVPVPTESISQDILDTYPGLFSND